MNVTKEQTPLQKGLPRAVAISIAADLGTTAV